MTECTFEDTYDVNHLYIPSEGPHHRDLKLSAVPVIQVEAFENLVQPFGQEAPEPINRSIVADLCTDVNGKVMIWVHRTLTVKLGWETVIEQDVKCSDIYVLA